jgi:chromosome segregation ATPase
MAVTDIIKAYAKELKETVQVIEANKNFFADKTRIDAALTRAKEVLEHLGEELKPPKTDDKELVKKAQEFHNKLGRLIAALDPAMQTTAERCKEIKEAVKRLTELPSRIPAQDAELNALETEDTEIKGKLYPALDVLQDKCKEIQKLLEQITGDSAKYNALEKLVKEVVEKDVLIFLTIQTQISKVYLTAEGKL